MSAATLRRAHAAHPVAAVQSEYSLVTRDVEHNGVLEVCHELGIGFVAFSPLGRGLLTSGPPDPTAPAADDFRQHIPRFHNEHFEGNLLLAQAVAEVARELDATTAQVALA